MIFVYESFKNRFRVETRDYFIGYLVKNSSSVWKFEAFECFFEGELLSAKDLQGIVDKLNKLNSEESQ